MSWPGGTDGGSGSHWRALAGPLQQNVCMGVVVDLKSVRSRETTLYTVGRAGAALRVRLDGLDRHESERAVRAGMEPDSTGQAWWTFPTAGGTYLGLTKKGRAAATAMELASRLEAAGLSGTVSGVRHNYFELNHRVRQFPHPAGAVLAYTIDPPYLDRPVNEYGVIVGEWGVPQDQTVALASKWVDWVIPEGGSAVVGPYPIPVTREDGVEVVSTHLEALRLGTELLATSPDGVGTRYFRGGKWGEVVLAETGSGRLYVEQAISLRDQFVIPHAAHVDYATVLVTWPPHQRLTTSIEERGYWWAFDTRNLWSQFVADPSPIQVLTDAHMDKAHDLTNWHVMRVVPGRWLVQAKDLDPWFDTYDYPAGTHNWRYTNPDVLDQARRDFGDTLLTEDLVSANRAAIRARPRPPKEQSRP